MRHVENLTGGSINQSPTAKGHEGPELAFPAPSGSRQMPRCLGKQREPSFPFPSPAHSLL